MVFCVEFPSFAGPGVARYFRVENRWIVGIGGRRRFSENSRMTDFAAVADTFWGVLTDLNRAPTSIVVLSIIGVILGGLNLLCAPFGLLGILAGENTMPLIIPGQAIEEVPMPPALIMLLVISNLVGFVASLLLVAGSLGSFRLKSFARPCMNGYAVISMINSLITTAGQMWLMLPVMMPALEASLPADAPAGVMKVAMVIGILIAVLCQWIYPLCVLFFYNTRRAREAFALGYSAQPQWQGYPQQQQPYGQPWPPQYGEQQYPPQQYPPQQYPQQQPYQDGSYQQPPYGQQPYDQQGGYGYPEQQQQYGAPDPQQQQPPQQQYPGWNQPGSPSAYDDEKKRNGE